MKKIQYILSVLLVAVFAVSCTQDFDIESQGYLSLRINSLVSTHTPNGTRAAAPEDYAAKTLHVEIRNAEGVVVKSTDDFENDATFQDNILLRAGQYTIIAHSAGWDGNGSGFDVPFYYGSTTIVVKAKSLVTASLTCTQANVKVTVNYDRSFVTSFQSAVTTINSALADIAPLAFVMNETTQSGYIPVGDFEAKLEVVNKKGDSYTLTTPFTDVQARDHYILNIKLVDEGYLGDGVNGGIKVEIDETTNTYTFTLQMSEKSAIAFVTREANAWSNFALLNAAITAKTSDFDNNSLDFQWRRAGETEWNVLPNSALTIDAQDNVSAKLTNLTPEKSYEYRLRYSYSDTEMVSSVVTFTTEKQIALYNGGFESWWVEDDNVSYPNEQGTSYWDTSNPGGASFGGSNTTQTTEVVHGGSSAAKLESKYIVIKFAAASLYTGSFGQLVGTSGAKLNWGIPFTARPTALKGYMQYAPVAINRAGSNLPADAPAKGETDQCGMYCALLSEELHVDNTNMSTFPNWDTDSRVIAYGELPLAENVNSNGLWKEVNIPFVYRDLNRKPTHLLVVFSASKYGDYFHGGEGSTLYVDDFSLEYGDTPSVK